MSPNEIFKRTPVEPIARDSNKDCKAYKDLANCDGRAGAA